MEISKGLVSGGALIRILGLNVTRQTICQRRKKGQYPYHKVGNRYYYDIEKIKGTFGWKKKKEQKNIEGILEKADFENREQVVKALGKRPPVYATEEIGLEPDRVKELLKK